MNETDREHYPKGFLTGTQNNTMKRQKIEEMFYNITDQTGMETVVIDVDDLRPFIKYSDWQKQEIKKLKLSNKSLRRLAEIDNNEINELKTDSNGEPLFDKYEIRDFIRGYLPDEYSKIMDKFQEWLNKQALKK